jgi:hypothetical protein
MLRNAWRADDKTKYGLMPRFNTNRASWLRQNAVLVFPLAGKSTTMAYLLLPIRRPPVASLPLPPAPRPLPPRPPPRRRSEGQTMYGRFQIIEQTSFLVTSGPHIE